MIASYGVKFILAGFILTVIFAFWAAGKDSLALFIVSLILAFLTLMLTFFYRNPSREITVEENIVLSNADGRVIGIEETENEFIGGKAWKISIFLSVLNVHINRIPINGRIEYIKYEPGKFFMAFRKEASEENERMEVGLSCGSGKIIFRQITGALARRIECRLSEGDQVTAGDIYGMIHFGSRAELVIPGDSEILVKKGDRVKAGITALARIKDL